MLCPICDTPTRINSHFERGIYIVDGWCPHWDSHKYGFQYIIQNNAIRYTREIIEDLYFMNRSYICRSDSLARITYENAIAILNINNYTYTEEVPNDLSYL